MKKYGMCRVDKVKVVMINVYVLKPRKRRSSTSSDHHHHDPQVHDWPKHNGSIGYNRKPPISATTTSKNPQAQLPIVMRSHKPQNERPTSGFGNWKLMLHPGSAQKSIFSPREKKEKKKKKRSQSISNKINAMTKDFRVKKKPGFMKKFLSIFQKRKWASGNQRDGMTLIEL